MAIRTLAEALLAAALGFGLVAACGDGKIKRSEPPANAAGAGGADDAKPGAGAGAGAVQSGDSGAPAGGTTGEPSRSEGGAAGRSPVGSAGGVGGGDSEAGAGGVAEKPLNLSLVGCTEVAGDRPPSSGNTSASRVADLVLGAVEAGEALSGSLAFQDSDAAELVVQVSGSNAHYVCPLSAAELTAGVAELDQLSLNPNFPEGSRIFYFAVRDQASNVSAYLVGSLAPGGAGPIDVCDVQGSLQLTGKVPSASTAFYTEVNGTIAEYGLSASTSGDLTIVASTRVHLSADTCSTLRLAGDASGTKPVGWDNCLLVEYRPGLDGPLEKAWYYCTDATIYSAETGSPLPTPLASSVSGITLDPPVPNPAPFGYPALAIDLLAEIPNPAPDFELTLYILDYASVGSTTDIWAISGQRID